MVSREIMWYKIKKAKNDNMQNDSLDIFIWHLVRPARILIRLTDNSKSLFKYNQIKIKLPYGDLVVKNSHVLINMKLN